ncbi:MAG: DUF29 domain-containing protein [Cyanobacterium sp. T60_A2020_053]|nr:DUF29 domain-containing protein [Cyanobacterium sp. T60_A2020_053]
MKVTKEVNLKKLYEIDDHLWLEETINLLKGNRLNELDIENLIEELESLAKRDKLAMASLLEQVIIHLLLLDYWHNEYERNHHHWQLEIISFRRQLNKRMTKNLYNYLVDNLDDCYDYCRKYVLKKSGLDTFPLQCPYSLEKILDQDFL